MKHSMVFYSLLCLTSCSGLSQSSFDHQMRQQGSFTCPEISANPIKKETLAAADVARVRCHQDQWRIVGNHASLIRLLYQKENCQGPLGEIHYSNGRCTLIRSTPNWAAEEEGKCFLRDVPIGRPVPIQHLKACARHVPEFCINSSTPEVNPVQRPDENHPVNTIEVKAKQYFARCNRYLE